MTIRQLFCSAAAAVLCAGILCGCAGSAPQNPVDTADTSEAVGEPTPGTSGTIDGEMTALEFTAGIKVGWNLGNTLDATGGYGTASETSWGNPRVTQELIDAVKDAGFNAVRIPTSWGKHLDESDNVDPEWMDRVQEIVDYAYNSDMYVILNIHHEEWHDPYYDNLDAASQRLEKLWTQIAERFRDYNERLIFEGLNEPRWRNTAFEWNGGNDEGRSVVNSLGKVFVEAVRATGGNNAKRFLMVCPYAANSSESSLAALELPDDDRVIVSVHAYIPYSFALQIPGTSNWSAERGNCTADIDTLAEVLDRLFISKGRAVIIGECGAMNRDNENARAQWAEYYFAKFKQIGVPCFWWDNGAFTSGETFGLFDRNSNTVRYEELTQAIMKGAEG